MHPTQLASSTKGKTPEQCLAFVLEGQLHAVPILDVQEIRRYSTPTPLPSAPAYVLGVINLRGTVVPVFDLRLRFGRHEPTYDRLTVIIIVVVGERHVGIVADDVAKVIAIEDLDVRPKPNLAAHIDMSFVQGLLRDGDDLVTLLDVGRLLEGDLGAVA